jgi:hypothetical protein
VGIRDRWRPPSGRLFEVECECGEEFRVPNPGPDGSERPDDPLLVRLEGRCPGCGLRLEEIDPFETRGAGG